VIKIEQLANFLEAEAEALAAQDELQSRAVALGIKALLPVAERKDQLFCLVEAQGAGRDVESFAHLADGHLVGHGRSLAKRVGPMFRM
jgi:hypothetical protein